MEKNIHGKMNSVASIPDNYVSILQLQERWLKEKARKQKLKDLVERGVKQQQVDDEQRKKEKANRMKVLKAMEPGVKLEDQGFRRHCGVNRWEKEPNCVEKEERKVSAIVSTKKEEDGGNSREKNKKWAKNKGGSVEEVVRCETKVSTAYIPRGENNPVKEEIPRVCTPKVEHADRDSIATETQFQDLWIKKTVEEEGRDVKRPARLNDRNRRHDWSSTCVIRATSTMVWAKKGNNDGAGGGNGI